MFNRNKISEKLNTFNSLSYWALLVLVAVLPVFVITANNVPVIMNKVFVGGSFVFLALILFAVTHMRMQEVALPRSYILGAAWLIPVAYLLSTLLSQGRQAFFGERLLMDSTGFILVTFIALTISAVTLNVPRRALGVYMAMLASASLLMITELYIFYTRFRAVEEGTTASSQVLSVIGSLNDLGIFFGLITIFVLLSLIMLPVTMLIRSVLWVVLVVSAYFLAVVNLTALWWIIAAFGLAFVVHSITDMYLLRKTERVGTFSVASLFILLIASTFIAVPTRNDAGEVTITGIPAASLNIGEFDVRPSWPTTVSLGSQSFEEEGMFFGAGPGSFYYLWSKNLPSSINVGPFWLTDFFYGIGFVPTSIISTGLVGAVAWLLFFGTFLWQGTRKLILTGDIRQGDVVGYIRVTSFVAALYLWVTAVIMVPSPVLIIYAALLTGVFIASLRFGAESRQFIRILFREKPQVGFMSTLILTVAILGSVGGIYGLYARYTAEAVYQKAVKEIADSGNVENAYSLVEKAIALNELDIYYRFKSNLDAIRIQNLMAENRPPEEVREDFETLLQHSIQSGLQATKLDPTDYQNWANLGNVYQSIVPYGVDGAIESAITQYDNALKYRPDSPTIYYSKAILERNRGNSDSARENVNKAITLRNQYTDAIFLLAQMQIEQNEVEHAINSVEAITLFNPSNSVAFFQLGLLYYSQESFIESAKAFERAVRINPEYANARYFLALSYWKLGNDAAALENFKKVHETNQENEEVARIIENMESGKEPFAHLDEVPGIADREGLPISAVGDGSQLNLDIEGLAE